MTLGASGGETQPLTRDQLLELPPVVTLETLGQALGVSAPTIRECHRRGDVTAFGIRVLRVGQQWRVVTADIWRLLGLNPAIPEPTSPAAAEPDISSPEC